ncbi:hypothetical protein PISMIDRAFT_683577 [Pisolithus microcarpus 441]|uniref:Uncharacterized protein n=1 Tax=Pisolithus microcarpus 441 TaxID=765257 RepID=A0A0C9ZGE5_9AGAM|nr:hypothetical protein PISMIDRAFT_683577 [Pisolithus microcarpus 441]
MKKGRRKLARTTNSPSTTYTPPGTTPHRGSIGKWGRRCAVTVRNPKPTLFIFIATGDQQRLPFCTFGIVGSRDE